MKTFYPIVLFLALILLSGCMGQATLLKMSEVEGDELVKIVELEHTAETDRSYSVVAYFPFPHPTVSSAGFTGGISLSGRFQQIKSGELEIGLTYRLSSLDELSDAFLPTANNVFRGEYKLGYDFPILKKEVIRLTKVWLITEEGSGKYYYMIQKTIPLKMLSLRLAINRDFYQHYANGYTDHLKSTYGEDLTIISGYKQGRAVVNQGTNYLRAGIAYRKAHYITETVRDENNKYYSGGFNRASSFYADASFYIHSSLDKVDYSYSLNNTDVTETVDMLPYLTRINVGGCLGYYQEFHSPGFPLMMSIYFEGGLRPGYYGKPSDAIYFRFGLGLGFGKVKK